MSRSEVVEGSSRLKEPRRASRRGPLSVATLRAFCRLVGVWRGCRGVSKGAVASPGRGRERVQCSCARRPREPRSRVRACVVASGCSRVATRTPVARACASPNIPAMVAMCVGAAIIWIS
eukprot:11196572-Lingulodinium_polyedra.AAC.1